MKMQEEIWFGIRSYKYPKGIRRSRIITVTLTGGKFVYV
jgi:hypothetical protein